VLRLALWTGLVVAAVAVASVSIVGCGSTPRKSVAVVTPVAGEVRSCSTRSQAPFPHAYSDPANLVIGPAVIVGGAEAGRTDPALVPPGDAWKMPMLVMAGHRVTVSILPPGRPDARLRYRAETPPAHPLSELPYEVTFIACKPQERSGSNVDGRSVTFWSGGFQYRKLPSCVVLDIEVDGRHPVQRSLALGRGGCEPA
jgi:hypothetical protein